MKAVLKTEWKPQQIVVKDVDMPKIGADEVLIKVAVTGICGSDIEIYDATVPIPVTLPVIVGHEFSGVVAEIGKGVESTEINIGDRVVSEAGVVCRRCKFCKMGKHNLCPHRKSIGFGLDGSFAEYVKVPYVNVHKLPDNLPLEEAALVEPTAVAVHAAIERAQVVAGDTAAVVGAGPVGLILVQLVKASGASVVQTDMEENRLKMAQELGADYTINVKKEDPVEKVKQLMGDCVDVVIEATGNPSAVNQAINLARKGGRIALLGQHPKPLEMFDITHIINNEKTILGCWTNTSSTWDRAIFLLSSGKVRVKPLITHVLPLEKAEHGFNLLKRREAIKILLEPPITGF